MNTAKQKHVITLNPQFMVEIPTLTYSVEQNKEWCTIVSNGFRQVIGFHEYERLYVVPGLYECLYYDYLKCESPKVVCDQLGKALRLNKVGFPDLRVLDFGAGNGMAGEELSKRGVSLIVGADILSEAKNATLRDRPEVYEGYVVDDFTQLTSENSETLQKYELNCLVQVAGLGFGDIPVEAFISAWNTISTPGWVVFNIKEDFLSADEPTGFSALIRSMIKDGIFDPVIRHRYCHRYSLSGAPLHYVVLAGKKLKNVCACNQPSVNLSSLLTFSS